ncbi:MAG: 3-hydroxybutyrate dehydrogenase [Hyphomicrobiales bacterium]|nr:MAG: 3-hydroxybutyrate dehydrogenase [Hyphomicrobiales bacterium]
MLKNKTALITGSTSGIGLGIAVELAKQNANVILNGFGSEADIKTAISTIDSLGTGRVVYSSANMLKVTEIEQMIADAEQQFGGVDILINNAGIQHVVPIENFPTQKWDDIIAINLTSAFHTTRLCLAKMRANNWGRIINVASVHGLVASVNKSAYVAAKHGIVGLTKTVALETAEQGITVNSICPGFTLTPLIQAQIDERAKTLGSQEAAIEALLGEKQPSKTFVQTEHLGQLALFLCSDAASQMTGISLPVDGGWTAQ